MASAGDETFLYLTTRGRVSGEPRTIEIWFVGVAGKHYVVAEMRERAGWVKNLRAHAAVTWSIGTREERCRDLPLTVGHARLVEPTVDPADWN